LEKLKISLLNENIRGSSGVSNAKLETKKSSSWRGKVRKTAVLTKIKPLFEKKKTEKERSTSIIYKNGKNFLLDVLGRAVPPTPLGMAVADLMAVTPALSAAVAAQRARSRFRDLGVITVGARGRGAAGAWAGAVL
jgi:hypothetical protein